MTLQAGSAFSHPGAIISTDSVMGSRIRAFAGAAGPSSLAWPTANKAILIPFLVDNPITITEMWFQAGTTPGTANFDLGVYRDNFTLIASLGATASVNTSDAILPAGGGDIADFSLTRGRYYMAMSAAAITITTRCAINGNGFLRALGCQQMLSAHPLPATITPAAHTDAYLPCLGMGVQFGDIL